MTRVITITSGKGGVGKTTTAINLAAAINHFGKNVILVDANLTTPNVGLHLGAPIVPVSLNHVLSGKADVVEAIYEHESGTKVIPSSLSMNGVRKLNQGKLKDVAKKLKKIADVVIFDSAAGLGDEAVAAIEAADEIVIVTNPELPAVTDALKTYKLVEQMGKKVHGVVVTRVKFHKHEMPLNNVAEMLELPIIGVVPEDERFKHSVVLKDAILHTHPRSRVAREYRKLAARLLGMENYKERVRFIDILLRRY
ncbi:septum site-determining protein MinD [Candidatus Pacearchaeota archaeon]|nr:MAG: septum site-determining protein MinD [Candidatus Pacearchaeota archaeon]